MNGEKETIVADGSATQKHYAIPCHSVHRIAKRIFKQFVINGSSPDFFALMLIIHNIAVQKAITYKATFRSGTPLSNAITRIKFRYYLQSLL